MGTELLSFISMITVFGMPLDVTLSELATESFLAANETTARLLAKAAEARKAGLLEGEGEIKVTSPDKT
jgi:hypothetical protein